jgi:hypothetical protein
VEVGKQLCDLLDWMHRQQPPLLGYRLRLHNLHLGADQQTVRLLPEFRCISQRVKWSLETLRERLRGRGAVMHNDLNIYDAPESYVRSEPRTDLFSLASVLYGLLTGQPSEGMFTGVELRRTIDAIPPEERWLYELIAINLSELREDRSCSARAFQLDLMRQSVTRR